MAHILPSGGGKALMNVDDSALLLLDHQSGLFQAVKDISVTELRANVCALARIATLLKLPIITTASVPDGPNGPVMPEIKELAPHAVYVPRQGEVNAWDNDQFVKTVRETGKKTLIMAGVPEWISRPPCIGRRRFWRSMRSLIVGPYWSPLNIASPPRKVMHSWLRSEI